MKHYTHHKQHITIWQCIISRAKNKKETKAIVCIGLYTRVYECFSKEQNEYLLSKIVIWTKACPHMRLIWSEQWCFISCQSSKQTMVVNCFLIRKVKLIFFLNLWPIVFLLSSSKPNTPSAHSRKTIHNCWF